MFATTLKHGCLMLTLFSTTSAVAQQSGNDYGPPPVDYQPAPPLPAELGFSYHHASTAAEGWLRGWSAVIHATGNYWLSVSQAAILFEHAKSLNTYNRRQWIAFRVWNRERLHVDRQQRKDTKRFENEAGRGGKYEAAYRLALNELDRTTGQIAWPTVLLAAEYDDLRSRVEALFREQAAYRGASAGGELTRCVEALRRALRCNIREADRGDYVAAQKFLRGLKYEGEFSTQANEELTSLRGREPRAQRVN